MENQKPKSENQNYNIKSKSDLMKRCYNFSLNMIKLLDSNNMNRVYQLILDQLLRASISIGANIVEAKSASSKRDFIKFYEIALKSANETKYWLCLMRDGLNLDKQEIGLLINEAIEISNIIAASLLTMKGKR